MRLASVRRSGTAAIAVVVAAATLSACGKAEVGDFRNDAENFIENDKGEVAKNLETTFTDAECTEPATTDIGTPFTCTATAVDGAVWEFAVEISGETHYTINTATPISAGTGTITVAPSTPS